MVKIHQHVKFQANPSMHSPANARKALRTDGRTDERTDGHAVKRLRLVGWTNGPMYRSKEGISGFGRTDGQPENIMPPAPKGGGIKIQISKFSKTRDLYHVKALAGKLTSGMPKMRKSHDQPLCAYLMRHDGHIQSHPRSSPKSYIYQKNEIQWKEVMLSSGHRWRLDGRTDGQTDGQTDGEMNRVNPV